MLNHIEMQVMHLLFTNKDGATLDQLKEQTGQDRMDLDTVIRSLVKSRFVVRRRVGDEMRLVVIIDRASYTQHLAMQYVETFYNGDRKRCISDLLAIAPQDAKMELVRLLTT